MRSKQKFEKQGPWLVLVFVGVFFLIVAEIFAIISIHDEVSSFSWGYTLRGYTGLGLFLGILAAVLSLLTFVYTLRKRALQEKFPFFRGTMMMWLWAHVYFGLLSLAAVILHAGPGLISSHFSTGKALLLVFLLLTLSGIAWRLIYRFFPPVAVQNIRNYSQTDSAQKAEALWIEIEKLSAGMSKEFQNLKHLLDSTSQDQRRVKSLVKALSPSEAKAFTELEILTGRRKRYLRRHKLQVSYATFLQGWRFLHIPVALVFIVVLIIHIVDALQIPQTVFPEQFVGFPPASDCASCHEDIYVQWSASMHAHAVTSPVTVVQTNQVAQLTLNDQISPDPALFCNNCHGPVGAMLSGSATLPFELANKNSSQSANEGVSCNVCHQFTGVPASGIGGFASVYQADLDPGRTFFGTIENPIANAYHQSGMVTFADDPSALCQSCHNVNFDLDGDGEIIKGVDLVLQTTYDEYEDYRLEGGSFTCITCHMPITDSVRAAESAELLFEQDIVAPERDVHDHSFTGVDYVLDTVAQNDPQRELREDLLESAASFEIDSTSIQVDENRAVRFDISITNIGAGHNLPTGFAFARQMWVEIIAKDENGTEIFTSGLLDTNTSDLCDSATLDDPQNPVLQYISGCTESDSQLVNFQLKLVDDIDILRDDAGVPVLNNDGEFIVIQAVGAEETWLQALTGGAVARVRPFDGQVLGPIQPSQTRTFLYEFILPENYTGPVTVTARLLFRNLPPYFLRALADHQPVGEIPQLAPLIGNLQIVEMGIAQVIFKID